MVTGSYMEPIPITATQGVCMSEYISVACLMCGQTISVQQHLHANGAHPICIECEDKLEDAKHETLSTD